MGGVSGESTPGMRGGGTGKITSAASTEDIAPAPCTGQLLSQRWANAVPTSATLAQHWLKYVLSVWLTSFFRETRIDREYSCGM